MTYWYGSPGGTVARTPEDAPVAGTSAAGLFSLLAYHLPARSLPDQTLPSLVVKGHRPVSEGSNPGSATH